MNHRGGINEMALLSLFLGLFVLGFALGVAVKLPYEGHASHTHKLQEDDNYWRGWHDGKKAEFEGSQVPETDGPSE